MYGWQFLYVVGWIPLPLLLLLLLAGHRRNTLAHPPEGRVARNVGTFKCIIEERGTRHEARGTFALSRSLTQLLLPQLRVCVGVCVVCVCVKVHSKCVSLFANCNHCCCCAANETKVKATSFARVQLSHKIPCKVVKEISIKPSLMTSCICSAVALHFTGCT